MRPANVSVDSTDTALPVTPNMMHDTQNLRDLLISRFRTPKELIADFSACGPVSNRSGYFRLGPIICYGQCSSGTPVKSALEPMHDAIAYESINETGIKVPFDAAQVIANLYNERYAAKSTGTAKSVSNEGLTKSLYYYARPLMPVKVRKHLQKLYLRGWRRIPFPQWPVDRTVENLFEHFLALSMKANKITRLPFIWFWPDGHQSCTVMTHDVETTAGRDFCGQLMDINDSFGIKSSFQVVPEERYPVPETYLDELRGRGFEINVQDLNHDGHLFSEHEEFLRRAKRIDNYRRKWNALGFRAGVLYRNTDWYDALGFLYDMSIPNVAHLDPQRGGCCTVFPFMIGKTVELPVTTIQDYSLFHILNDYSISMWKEQISLIREKHGFINIIVHPDYIMDSASQSVYCDLLGHLSALRDAGATWIALPRDVAKWWRVRSELSLVKSGNSWEVQGSGAEHARVAYASIVDGKVQYEVIGSDRLSRDSAKTIV